MFDDLPPYTLFYLNNLEATNQVAFLTTGGAEGISDLGATVYPVRGESRQVTVYYYNGNDATAAPPPGTSDTGTIRVTLLGCLDGTDPAVDPSACTTTLEDDGSATIYDSLDQTTIPLADLPRNGDTYVLADVPAASYALSGVKPVESDNFLVTGQDENHDGGYTINLEPGETRDVSSTTSMSRHPSV